MCHFRSEGHGYWSLTFLAVDPRILLPMHSGFRHAIKKYIFYRKSTKLFDPSYWLVCPNTGQRARICVKHSDFFSQLTLTRLPVYSLRFFPFHMLSPVCLFTPVGFSYSVEYQLESWSNNAFILHNLELLRNVCDLVRPALGNNADRSRQN